MRNWIFFSVLLVVGSLSLSSFSPIKEKDQGQFVEVNWMSWEEALAANEVEPRPMIIDIWTTWCGWCKKMDQGTFGQKHVAEYIGKNYYAIKLNGERKTDLTFKGHTFKFVANGRRGYHEFPAALMNGKLSYPTIVFINEKLELLQAMPGYKSAQDIHPILEFFATKTYESKQWTEFLQNDYVSPWAPKK